MTPNDRKIVHMNWKQSGKKELCLILQCDTNIGRKEQWRGWKQLYKIKVLLPTDAQEYCFKRTIKIYIKKIIVLKMKNNFMNI